MHELPNHAPTTEIDFLWWGFNLLVLVLIAWGKADLSAIKRDTARNRELHEATARRLETREGICEERHRRLDFELSDMKKRMEV